MLRRDCVLILCALLPALALARDEHSHGGNNHGEHKAPAQSELKSQGASAVKVTLADTSLLDQDGRKVRMKSDILAGRIVVVDFIYTTCTTICPIFSATMASVQERLEDRLGRDVLLITVTVDPQRDTPRRLREYAAKHQARHRGWTFLTGSKPDIDAVNKALGSYTPNFDDHPPMVMVGDTESGEWTRFYGFPTAAELESRVRKLLAARQSKG
jgi:protein SCO1/2